MTREISPLPNQERTILQPVALSGALLEYSLRSQILMDTKVPRIDPSGSYLLETTVRVQPFTPALYDNDRISLSTRYAEITWSNSGRVSEEDYTRATSDLVFNGGDSPTNHSYPLEELLQIQGSPHLSELAMRAQSDPRLAKALCYFLDNLAAYTADTGGALVDVIGKDNVFYLDAKGIMTDGLYAEDTTPIAGSAIALNDLAEGNIPQRSRMNECFNALNFLRGMNIIAIACSSPIRLSLDAPRGVETEVLLKEVVGLSRQQYGLRGDSRITQ